MGMDTHAHSRRNFIKLAGVSLGTAVGSAACGAVPVRGPETPTAPKPTAAKPSATPEVMAMAMPEQAATPAGGTAPEMDMDAMHEAGVKKFLDNVGKDPTFWRAPMVPVMDGAVKVYNLTAGPVTWAPDGGDMVVGMGYNGMVPGPEIRITEGDTVRVVLTNQLNESTAIHFHGVLLPNAVDGVPFITQKPVKTGQTFSYEFTAKNSGSHMYHSHLNSAVQVTAGLLGALIIEPKDKSQDPVVDSEYTMILNDTVGGYTINGKGFPYTQPIIAKKGERIRIRYMNEGLMIHPMHLHGIEQQVFAKDGWKLPQPYTCDTLNIAPGERYDTLINAHTEGIWAFHCHILTHAEAPNGMFGMVTVLIVK